MSVVRSLIVSSAAEHQVSTACVLQRIILKAIPSWKRNDSATLAEL